MSEFENMVAFIKSSWKPRKYIVPCLLGPAGIGKTAACRQAALELKEEGLATGKVVTIIASQILPNEVSGITMPVPETKAMEIFDHYRLSSLQDGDVLFFDELLEADQLVLSACLTLIESRELMSGHKLPDIMIVAATNATINPGQLKPNIRQRFCWRNFTIDREGTRKYIKELCGIDVGDAISSLIDDNREYNILTPRSLTKMAQWMSEAKSVEEAEQFEEQINMIWNSSLGTKLKKSFLRTDPAMQARDAIKQILRDLDNPVEVDFECSTMTEVMDALKALPEWKLIEEKLSEKTIDDDKVRF